MTVSSTDTSTVRGRRLNRLLAEKAVAVLRINEPAVLPSMAESLLKGGIAAIEVTMTMPDPLDAIDRVCSVVGEDGIVGVGSTTRSQDVIGAVEAGAEFAVSPVFKREIVDTAHEKNVPAIPGALTPTEIQNAHEAGADVVKVFPASAMGMDYLESIKAPLPDLRLCPTGGVSLGNAGEWLHAGASMVAVGSALLDGVDPAVSDLDTIAANARQLRQCVDAAPDG